MARPKKATVDYFPHSCNHGKTITILQQAFGLDGYAVWFKLLEQLGKTDKHYIDCRDDTTWLYLSAEIGIVEDKLTDILNLCSRLKAIDKNLWENKIIASENFLENIKDAYKQRTIEPVTISFILMETGLSCMETKLNGISMHDNPVNESINQQSKVDETIIDKSKLNKETPLPENLNTEDFKKAWGDWNEHRLEIKKKITPLQAKALLKKMSIWGSEETIARINQSIENGYQGLFELKGKTDGGFSTRGKSGIREGARSEPGKFDAIEKAGIVSNM